MNKIKWIEGNYSYSYGYKDQVKLFILGWENQKYKLTSTLPAVKSYESENQEELKQKAEKIIDMYIEFLKQGG